MLNAAFYGVLCVSAATIFYQGSGREKDFLKKRAETLIRMHMLFKTNIHAN